MDHNTINNRHSTIKTPKINILLLPITVITQRLKISFMITTTNHQCLNCSLAEQWNFSIECYFCPRFTQKHKNPFYKIKKHIYCLRTQHWTLPFFYTYTPWRQLDFCKWTLSTNQCPNVVPWLKSQLTACLNCNNI